MKKIDLQGHVYSWPKAQEVALQLQNAELDGWTYHPTPSSEYEYGRVAVYDECSCFVGYF